LTHFYALSALDLVQGPAEAPWTPFWDDSYYDPALLNKPVGSTTPNANLSYNGSGAPLNIYTAVITDYVLALRARTKAIDLGAIFGGRLPISSTYVPGGTTKLPTHADVLKARSVLSEVRSFILNNYIPMTEIVSALHGLADNDRNDWYTPLNVLGYQDPDGANIRGPYSCRDAVVNNINLKKGLNLGAGCRNYYAAGGFDLAGNLNGGVNRLFPRGARTGATNTGAGNLEIVDGHMITESVKHAYYDEGAGNINQNLYPGAGVTRPNPTDNKGGAAYTWHKATRYSHDADTGQDSVVKEVGPLARMWVKGAAEGPTSRGYCGGMTKPLHKHAMAGADGPLPDLTAWNGHAANAAGANGTDGYFCGSSLLDRHRARALEALLIADSFSGWLDELDAIVSVDGWATNPVTREANKRFKDAPNPLENLTADGFGMAEAPRGAVHHFISVKSGKIDNYQIIAPTTWNCSGRDSSERLGPVEQALVGMPLRGVLSDGKNVPVEALLVVHSFDPCIACSVHEIEPAKGTDMKKFVVDKGGATK
jgi:Ni,Fe-hydrogenase I large subunit